MFSIQWRGIYLKWRRFVLFVAIAVFSIFGSMVFVLLRPEKGELPKKQENVAYTSETYTPSAEYMRVPLHDWELRYHVPKRDEQNRVARATRIFGGIVPHHLAAQSFIAEMFSLLADRENRPKTVVILSPNHLEVGESFVQTANMVWETPDGPIGTDAVKSEEIAVSFKTSFQNESMRSEHGVYNIIPFVKHFLPNANVVPITLRFATPTNDQNLLREILSKWFKQDNNVVVIASIDFSHYLSFEEAQKKDDETRAAMERYDFAEIASYRSDHLDSPVGLIVLLRTMQSLDANRQTILQYDNSGKTLNRPFTKTTSHFLVTFTQI